MADDEIPLPRGGYNIDFDNLDLNDPNFNPFATKSKVVVNFDENAPLSLSTKQNKPPNDLPVSNLEEEKTSLTVNVSQSPDENKNPNLPKHSSASSSLKSRSRLRKNMNSPTKKSSNSTALAEKNSDDRENSKPKKKVPHVSLKDKIAEMRRKKQEEEQQKQQKQQQQQQQNNNNNNSTQENFVGNNIQINTPGDNIIKSNEDSSSVSQINNKLSKLKLSHQYSTESSANTLHPSDINLPDSGLSATESNSSKIPPNFTKSNSNFSDRPATPEKLDTPRSDNTVNDDSIFATPCAVRAKERHPEIESPREELKPKVVEGVTYTPVVNHRPGDSTLHNNSESMSLIKVDDCDDSTLHHKEDNNTRLHNYKSQSKQVLRAAYKKLIDMYSK